MSPASSQDSTSIPLSGIASPLHVTAAPIRGRVWTVAGVHAGVYAGSLIILNEAWFADYPRRSFHSFDDSKEWLQVDKIGHGWSAYTLSRISGMSWKWTGMSANQASFRIIREPA